MTAQLLAAPFSYFADSNGAPLAGGKIYSYAAGTLTPQATYTDSTGGTPNANPVVLDSAGRAQIWLVGSYKIIVKDSSDNTIMTVDNITPTTANGDMLKATYDPNSVSEQLVGMTATQTLSNKTLTSPSLSNPTVTGGLTTPKITFNSTSGIIGTTTNDNAAAGSVGEVISSSVASGSAVSLVTGTAKDVTTISLTAGDWEVSGVVNFTGGATTTVTKLSGGISTTTNTMPTQSTTNPGTINLMCYSTNWAAFQNGDPSVALPPARISIASTTTIYLDALAVFGTSTASAYGMIKARRVR